MAEDEVPSGHRFFDRAYVQRWADGAAARNPQRAAFMELFAREVEVLGRRVAVVEPGCGPGFLAEHLLGRCPVDSYYLVDFSPQMLDLALARLAAVAGRGAPVFIEADFRAPDWPDRIPGPADVAVSLQALHELRHADRAPDFYRRLRSVLRTGGVVLVCDRLRRADDARPLFMTVPEHLAALRAGGFADPLVVAEIDGMALFRAWNPPERAA